HARRPPLKDGRTSMDIQRTVAGLRGVVSDWRRQGLRIALVPTMGALHDGHLSLVRLARACADRVLVSIFVNPRQFAAHEDLGAYPRREAGDVQVLAAEGCDLLFAPSPRERGPDGLALSSRNAYLSSSEREIAVKLNQTLRRAAEALAAGETIAAAQSHAQRALADAGFGPIDYVAVRDADDLGLLPGPG